MKKRYLLILFCFALAGCLTTGQSSIRRLTHDSRVAQGMSAQEVGKILGTEVIVGYEAGQPDGEFKPVTVNNPYRREQISQNNRRFDVAFYLTHIRQSDGVVTDDELTPYVFEDDRFIGKGWYFLNNILQKD